MYSTYAQLISLMLIMVYIYIKLKFKTAIWIVSFVFYFLVCAYLFRKLFPNIPFHSPTPQYMGFLVIIWIPLLVIIGRVILEAEKGREQPDDKEHSSKDVRILFEFTKDNIIFWSIIAVINLMAFLLEANGK